MTDSSKHARAAQHAAAVYDLAVRLSEVLAAALADSIPMTGSPLKDEAMDRDGLAGVFQYGLVYCAQDKCRLNRVADDAYWRAVEDSLEFMVTKGSRGSAQKILEPLRALSSPEEMGRMTAGAHQPLEAFRGTSLAYIEKGPEKTPVGVMVRQIVPLFYAQADHSSVADKIVSISFEGIKVLFTDGGLA